MPHHPAHPLDREAVMLTPSSSLQRRAFLQTASALVADGWVGAGRAEEPRRSSQPRATSGDDVEPDWQERATITVGPARADLVGTTDKVLQAAVDYLARLGG